MNGDKLRTIMSWVATIITLFGLLSQILRLFSAFLEQVANLLDRARGKPIEP